MKDYFTSKRMKDFNNAKQFWSFCSTTIKVHSDKSSSTGLPDTMLNGEIEFNGNEAISTMINTFFTTISSNSTETLADCGSFSTELFTKFKRKNMIKVPAKNFEFSHCDEVTVSRLLGTIDTSSGGSVSGILAM
jgi:hypothetical protein